MEVVGSVHDTRRMHNPCTGRMRGVQRRPVPTASATLAKPSRASSASSPARMRGTSAEPAVDEGGVELHRRGAGADLGVGVLGRADAADADQRQPAAGQRVHAREHRGRAREERRARTGRRPRAAWRLAQAVAGEGGVGGDDAGDPGLERHLDERRRARRRRGRARSSGRPAPAAASARVRRRSPRRAGRASAAAPCRSRSRSVLGEETLTVAKSTKRPGRAPAPRRSPPRGRRSPCSRRGSARRRRPAAAPRAARRSPPRRRC